MLSDEQRTKELEAFWKAYKLPGLPSDMRKGYAYQDDWEGWEACAERLLPVIVAAEKKVETKALFTFWEQRCPQMCTGNDHHAECSFLTCTELYKESIKELDAAKRKAGLC